MVVFVDLTCALIHEGVFEHKDYFSRQRFFCTGKAAEMRQGTCPHCPISINKKTGRTPVFAKIIVF